MALRNTSIRGYFKPSLHPPEVPTDADLDKARPLHMSSISSETADEEPLQASVVEAELANGLPCEPGIEDSDASTAVPGSKSAVIQSSRDRIINGSDEEDSNSDSSLEDIYVALQQQSRPELSSSAANGFKSPEKSRARNKRTRLLVQPSPSKPKYKFDMKTLIEQAERHKATEASALSVNELLTAPDTDSQGNSEEVARDGILQSIIAKKDGVDPGKFLLAVKRIEATRSEKGWCFFDSVRGNSASARPLPASMKIDGWKAMLADSQSRDQLLLSGFVRDMVGLEGTIDDELFGWMLGEICFEHRNDVREAYCKVLEVMEEQMELFVSSEVIKRLFETLGAKESALDINEEPKLTSKDQSPYEGHDWSTLAVIVSFLGRISKCLSIETSSYTMSLLTRLCIDSIVIEDINLLAAVQITMEQICSRVGDENWEKLCQNTSAATFQVIKPPALQLQVLRCIPSTTRRVHELRRRLALAFFFEEIKYIFSAPHDSLDLSDVIETLKRPQFIINKDMDYPELAAVMSILNIAIDNGLSVRHDVTHPKGELDFNREVDVLAARIKQIWGGINDAGAAFMSRSYAKEMMDGLRMRLELTVRTKSKQKLSIFETAEPNEDGVVLKQTTLSRKLFQKKPVDKGIA